MKKANCPFCGHRWVCRSDEAPITCPQCQRKFYSPEQLLRRKQK